MDVAMRTRKILPVRLLLNPGICTLFTKLRKNQLRFYLPVGERTFGTKSRIVVHSDQFQSSLWPFVKIVAKKYSYLQIRYMYLKCIKNYDRILKHKINLS